MELSKKERRYKIKKSIRNKISGTAEKLRLSIFRSNNQIYAQLIDDVKGDIKKIDQAKIIGRELGKKALDAGITSIRFDRNGYLYHGRVKSFAEAVRESGLKF